MNEKILVMIYVPTLEQEYDMYIPIVKKIGVVKKLIMDVIEEASEGNFINDGCKFLYDKITGEKLNENEFVKNSNIKNGSKLILY